MNGELLAQYGIDYNQGIENCMHDEAFYARFLTMFLADTSFSRGKQALAADDYETCFYCMHELKGVSGNAALSGLYAAVTPFVELLRDENHSRHQALQLFAAVQVAYDRTLVGIRQALSM